MGLLAILIGSSAAFILTVRFGLTLQTSRRALRYAMFAVVAIVLLSPLNSLVTNKAVLSKVPLKLLVGRHSWFQQPPDISPDGRYAIVCQPGWTQKQFRPPGMTRAWPYMDITKQYWMVRLSDGKRARITWPEPHDINWTSSDAAYGILNSKKSHALWIVRMDASGKIRRDYMPIGSGYSSGLLPSPDRRLAIVSSYLKHGNGRQFKIMLEFVDVENARRLPITIRDVSWHFAAYWWQNNRKVGYIDTTGERRFVILPD